MMSLTSQMWLPRNEVELKADLLRGLSQSLQVGLLTARILVRRGILDAGKGRSFFHCPLAELPDPWLLPGMEPAVVRLTDAIQRQELILVHGDYDVDGISGTALLVETLRALGGKVDYHIPLRLKDGYGLSASAVRSAAATEVKVLLSVDCGISAVDEARLARELGLDLVVTDHHLPPPVLPQALALVNPLLPGNSFPSDELSGVGVAFFLLVALRQALRQTGHFNRRIEPDLRLGLDLVGLGTIADVVPLRGVNRCLVKAGLKLLATGGRTGIDALKEVAGIDKVNCGSVGFGLAPRLNAAGRLEDATLGVQLLLEKDREAARSLAEDLDRFNRERQLIEKETLEQALLHLEESGVDGRHALVLADARWHPGVIGIVASRLVERFHRPALLIALEDGRGKGSGRSIPGFHLYQGLEQCGNFLDGFGGHQMAAGISISAERVDAFSEAFEKCAAESIRPEDLIPQKRFDDEVLLEELTLETVRELERFSPCGAGNPEPLLLACGIRALKPRIVGEKHLQFTAGQGGYSHPCIAFGMASLLPELPRELDLLFSPAVNEWRGRKTVQLVVRDLRPAQSRLS